MRVVNRLLPADSPKRMGGMYPTHITIHQTTATPNTIFNMLYGNSAKGFHFVIKTSYTKIYQFLETEIATNHCDNPIGDTCSISIIVLIDNNSNISGLITVLAKLVATLMRKYEIPIECVVPASYWFYYENINVINQNGKNGEWDRFIKKVKLYFNKKYQIEGVR